MRRKFGVEFVQFDGYPVVLLLNWRLWADPLGPAVVVSRAPRSLLQFTFLGLRFGQTSSPAIQPCFGSASMASTASQSAAILISRDAQETASTPKVNGYVPKLSLRSQFQFFGKREVVIKLVSLIFAVVDENMFPACRSFSHLGKRMWNGIVLNCLTFG
jgi:hypothetical protein